MTAPSDRLISLDQFRGYTVVAMLFVNFAGGYKSVPTTFGHHHTYCSFADTIMPQFLFAVGFAMRLTFLKRLAVEGPKVAYRKAVMRCFALILLGCVIYKLTGKFQTWDEIQHNNWPVFFEQLFKRGPFETLTHIGVTSLFVLPVIARSLKVRMAFAILSAVAHIAISLAWYYRWNLSKDVGIDGGPLAFLSWTIPLLLGSIAYDLMDKPRWMMFIIGLALCLIAMLMMYAGNQVASFPFTGPEHIKPELNYWTMSQRAGSVTYTLFGAGFALIIFQVFRFISDDWKFTLSIFDLFGRHALATYIIHEMVSECVKPFVPRDAPLWYVLSGFSIYFFITWLFVRYLDKSKLFLRL